MEQATRWEIEAAPLLEDVHRCAQLPRTPCLDSEEWIPIAHQAALSVYGVHSACMDCPVWASDAVLTAAHLVRRRASMDPICYQDIVAELSRRYRVAVIARCGAGVDKPVAGRPADGQQRHDAFRHDVQHAAAAAAAAKGGSSARQIVVPPWDGDLLAWAHRAAQRVFGMDAPVWASDGELTAPHLVRYRETMDALDYGDILSALGELYIQALDERALQDSGSTDDDVSAVFSSEEEEGCGRADQQTQHKICR